MHKQLVKGNEEGARPLHGAQDKRKRAQTETQQIPFNHKKSRFFFFKRMHREEAESPSAEMFRILQDCSMPLHEKGIRLNNLSGSPQTSVLWFCQISQVQMLNESAFCKGKVAEHISKQILHLN